MCKCEKIKSNLAITLQIVTIDFSDLQRYDFVYQNERGTTEMTKLSNKFFGFTYGFYFSRRFVVPEYGNESR